MTQAHVQILHCLHAISVLICSTVDRSTHCPTPTQSSSTMLMPSRSPFSVDFPSTLASRDGSFSDLSQATTFVNISVPIPLEFFKRGLGTVSVEFTPPTILEDTECRDSESIAQLASSFAKMSFDELMTDVTLRDYLPHRLISVMSSSY